MKKILLATVAVIALGATVPALAADLGAAPRTYTKAPAYVQPIYNWTGFYIGGHIGGAFSGSNSLEGDSRFLGGVQGGADYQFGNNWVIGAEVQYSWMNNNNGGVTLPGGDARELQQRSARIGHRPARLLVRPDLALRQGRLCLEGQRQSDRERWPVRRSPSPPAATTTMATPSVRVSNTCSPRTGPPRSSTSTTTSAARPS